MDPAAAANQTASPPAGATSRCKRKRNPNAALRSQNAASRRPSLRYDPARLEVEIATGFLMHVVGDNIRKAVETVVDSNVTVNEDLHGRVWLNGSCIESTKATEHCTHFVVRDVKSHDPYDYGMQLPKSHQFCQTHSLLMLVDPLYRVKTDVDAAYKKLLQFWNLYLHRILSKIKKHEVLRCIDAVETTQFEANEPIAKYEPIVKKMRSLAANPKLLAQHLIGVMTTSYAMANVPFLS